MQASGCKLAADLSRVHKDTVSVSGLFDVDLLKYPTPMKLFHFMTGAAFELAQGFVPFGNREDFLPDQKTKVDPQIYMNYSQVISQYPDWSVIHLYFVLEPKSKYQGLLDCFTESSVERTVEKIFNLETMGIRENSVIMIVIR